MRRSIANSLTASALCLCWSLPIPGAAQVYKQVGPDGSVIYTDRPAEQATRLDLPRSAAPTEPNATGGDDTGDGFLGSYSAFEIATPDDNATVRNEAREVQISLLLDPALQSGHRLSLRVNDVPATGESANSTHLKLTDMPLGSHRIQAQVLDDGGVVVAQTPSINVHVRQPLPEGALP